MKKIFAVLLITLLCSIFAFSQTENNQTADWKIFAPEIEEFSVEVPVALDASIFKNSNANGNMSRRYLNSLDGTYFFIFSDAAKKPFNLTEVEKFVKSQNQTGQSETNEDFEVEKFAFSDSELFYHTILIAKGKNRSYAFHTVSPTKDNAEVERFFGSLKFVNSRQAENTVEKTEQKQIDITVSDPDTKTFPIAPGTGYGRGRGNGIGSGSGGYTPAPETKPTPSPNPGKVTAGVKILAKPRASYTDFARFYEIQGKVVVRVTFSANGTIGSVALVSRLPFGLTEQAIIAAKGITFEPALREGTPISVVKMVEYSFTIY